jgi:hypothetical protein
MSKITTSPIGTLMSNTHLHPKVAVIAPPKIIPAVKLKFFMYEAMLITVVPYLSFILPREI